MRILQTSTKVLGKKKKRTIGNKTLPGVLSLDSYGLSVSVLIQCIILTMEKKVVDERNLEKDGGKITKSSLGGSLPEA